MEQDKNAYTELPPEIEDHLRKLVRSLSPEDADQLYNRLYRAWREKQRLFSEQTVLLDMEEVEELSAEDERGMLIFTSSGSLLSFSPSGEGGREIEYASIPLRADVPEILKGSGVSLSHGVRRGEALTLENAPVKKSSPVYRIAVCPAGTPPEEQTKRIREAAIFLTNGFTYINKSAAPPESGGIEHFTKAHMVSYVAKRNELSQKAVRQVIEDYLSMIESGILLGEKVSLGNLGRMSLRTRPAQKARVGRNPATGEEMTIPAKAPQAVPKMSFSSLLKERASQVDLKDEERQDESADRSEDTSESGDELK